MNGGKNDRGSPTQGSALVTKKCETNLFSKKISKTTETGVFIRSTKNLEKGDGNTPKFF